MDRSKKMLAKLTRGDGYREAQFLRGLILADSGAYETLTVAKRLADDLSGKVSP